jgi:hypothetical protein
MTSENTRIISKYPDNQVISFKDIKKSDIVSFDDIPDALWMIVRDPVPDNNELVVIEVQVVSR